MIKSLHRTLVPNLCVFGYTWNICKQSCPMNNPRAYGHQPSTGLMCVTYIWLSALADSTNRGLCSTIADTVEKKIWVVDPCSSNTTPFLLLNPLFPAQVCANCLAAKNISSTRDVIKQNHYHFVRIIIYLSGYKLNQQIKYNIKEIDFTLCISVFPILY